MNIKITLYFAVPLIVLIIVYLLIKEPYHTPQNHDSISLIDSVKISDSSKTESSSSNQHINQDTAFIMGGNTQKDSVKKSDVKLIVYYFHAAARCTACINIENFTEEIVNTELAKEKKSVKIIFRSLNIEDSVNEHYITDFKLEVGTVILAKMINNKQVSWINLEHVWKYAEDKTLFYKYVKNGIKDFLNLKEEA